MRDFIFTGTVGEVTVNVTFRTDAPTSDSENFNILQIHTGESFTEQADDGQASAQMALFNDFKRIASSKQAFIDFALEQNLNLSVRDSNGENEDALVAEGSDSGSLV